MYLFTRRKDNLLNEIKKPPHEEFVLQAKRAPAHSLMYMHEVWSLEDKTFPEMCVLQKEPVHVYI